MCFNSQTLLPHQTGSGRTRRLPPLEYESAVDDVGSMEKTTGLVHPEHYADDFIDDVSVDRLSPPPSGSDRLFLRK